MKKLNILLLLIVNLNLLKAQENITISSPINDQDPRIINGTIEARDYIKLNGIFSYNATENDPVTIKVNPNLVCPATYSLTPMDGNNRILDTDLAVGSLPGSINVSPTGAATYTIPITVPQGTAGMQPNLSIV